MTFKLIQFNNDVLKIRFKNWEILHFCKSLCKESENEKDMLCEILLLWK